jgi:E3 ubiquitin-protein ligase HERC2
MKENNYQTMRKNDADSQAWRINFIGEGSIDAGGPYRESITNMCDEMMSSFLPLFIPSQNNKNDHGQNRDCWTINPASTSPVHLEMYEFVGALMGFAFRSGSILDIKLSQFFYRGLTGEPLDIADLRAVDAYAVQAIKDLDNAKKQLGKELFNQTMTQTWVTRLSNGEEYELIEDGANKTVDYDSVTEYNKKTLEARFKEGEKQMSAIRKGFEYLFPTSVMGILTPNEVEYRVCGPNTIDVDVLKKISSYSSCSETDEYIVRFWKAIEGFTEHEKRLYLKFVWGRSRLPPEDHLKECRHTVMLHSAGHYPDHDI